MSDTSKRINTDNFKGNMLLFAVLIGPVIFFLLIKKFNLSLYSPSLPFHGAFGAFCVFTFLYVFASRFYTPDLDHRKHRPGMAHFPFGKKTILTTMKFSNTIIKLGGIFKILHYLIEGVLKIQRLVTLIWYWFWFPASLLTTHRGSFHWPIIGVLLRHFYLLSPFYLLNLFKIHSLDSVYLWMKSYVHYSMSPEMTVTWIILVSPLYLSDIAHSLVDLHDSLRNGTPFCSRENPQGLIVSFFRSLSFKK